MKDITEYLKNKKLNNLITIQNHKSTVKLINDIYEKNKSILIIGLGSIGARYVEAIYKNNFFNEIYFFDKEKISKKIPKKNKKI